MTNDHVPWFTGAWSLVIFRLGDVAQLGEHRLCKPGVGGSSPLVSTGGSAPPQVLALPRPLISPQISATSRPTAADEAVSVVSRQVASPAGAGWAPPWPDAWRPGGGGPRKGREARLTKNWGTAIFRDCLQAAAAGLGPPGTPARNRAGQGMLSAMGGEQALHGLPHVARSHSLSNGQRGRVWTRRRACVL